MALGGVDMGSIKAQLAAIVAGIVRNKGFLPRARAIPVITGIATVISATLLITSVINKTTVVNKRINKNKGQLLSNGKSKGYI